MTRTETQINPLHQDTDLFRESVNFTAAHTAFVPRLIEKDYFCTLLLSYLAPASRELVFKGGTCIAKVYSGFYRMSEDLDFAISIAESAGRAERRKRVAGLKKVIESLHASLPYFSVIEPLTGANNSTQYTATIGYRSLLEASGDTIHVEVSLREPLLTPPHAALARTLLLDPVSGESLIKPFEVNCISWIEAFAEKFRAALTRREVAIRDFFDLDYAVRRLGLKPADPALTRLVRQKLSIADNAVVNVSEARLASLRREVETRLKPVLRNADFMEFDVERAFRTVSGMAKRVSD